MPMTETTGVLPLIHSVQHPENKTAFLLCHPENTGTGVSISPNPFSPDNDGYEDFTIIH